MSTEAGDKKFLGNFRQLIDHISAEPNYNPANPKLKKTALEAQYTAGQAAVDAVPSAQAPNKLAITHRENGFAEMRQVAGRSFNSLKASGAPAGFVEDAKTSRRKLTGGRVSAKVKDDPKTPGDESKGSHSASQMSYDNQLGNLGAYLAILSNVPAYNPNEADLKLAALQAMAVDLKARNDAVSNTLAPLSQARGLRDQLLYSNEDAIANTAALVKAYVSGALGSNSTLYKQIKGLRFKKPNK